MSTCPFWRRVGSASNRLRVPSPNPGGLIWNLSGLPLAGAYARLPKWARCSGRRPKGGVSSRSSPRAVPPITPPASGVEYRSGFCLFRISGGRAIICRRPPRLSTSPWRYGHSRIRCALLRGVATPDAGTLRLVLILGNFIHRSYSHGTVSHRLFGVYRDATYSDAGAGRFKDHCDYGLARGHQRTELHKCYV